jgi:hypothetical protein
MHDVFRFDFSNLKGDFFGGITAGIVALPLALAFGEQTELGAIAGLYGAIAIGILAGSFWRYSYPNQRSYRSDDRRFSGYYYGSD